MNNENFNTKLQREKYILNKVKLCYVRKKYELMIMIYCEWRIEQSSFKMTINILFTKLY